MTSPDIPGASIIHGVRNGGAYADTYGWNKEV
jgi:hypothetical protein